MSRAVKKPKAPQRWLHALCDFCGDIPLCCSVCFCACNAMGQMYQRSTKQANACIVISVFAWFIFLTTMVLSQTSNALANSAVRQELVCTWWGECSMRVVWAQMTAASIIGGISGVIGFVGTVFGTYVVCTSRRMVRHRDEIPEGACGGCDDCCVSYWCSCCAILQLLKQERISGAEYRACTPMAV